ncbi:hypothetical protein BRARA_A02031 [Brassica rapa]|uniref:Transcription repressor n=1 Tax=Brassica campestris TaxID=3711 RepID=A0A398ANM8_BRACM|nr:hypothetical protein BRARA_A02031 [Brassica rapa]
MSTFLRKKLHLCFSSSGVVSPSIPSSPIVVPNHNPPSNHHHHHTPSIFINNFNSLYDHLSVSSPLHPHSPDPCRDFGRSMREMVEARDPTRDDVSDREYLNELLFCYLSLNPKHTHKFIVSAFADTLLWLLSQSSSPGSALSQSI